MNKVTPTRRDFLKTLGIGAASMAWWHGLPGRVHRHLPKGTPYGATPTTGKKPPAIGAKNYIELSERTTAEIFLEVKEPNLV